jgi:hexosaminidase
MRSKIVTLLFAFTMTQNLYPSLPPRRAPAAEEPQANGVNARNLMPLPASMTARQGTLAIDSGFRVRLVGYRDAKVEAAGARLVAAISRATGMPLASQTPVDDPAAPLAIDCKGAGEAVLSPSEDESYSLDITPERALLTANTPTGVVRGTATFLQLVQPGPEGFAVPAVRIDDKPRFAWRGLMIDVSRHWIPADVIKRNLDAMAAVKLNVLHWHLSDDQGFRVESKKFPKLQELASGGLYYTQEEIRGIVAYAGARGIRVMPEFDIPGHTSALLAAYPELASGPGPHQIERYYGVFNQCLDPTREEVYSFLDGLIGEMAALFPDPYFHIGGDEVNGRQWMQNPAIQAFMSSHGMKTKEELQAYFTRRVEQIVTRHGKRVVGWDEILSPDLPKGTVVHSWRGAKSLAQAVKAGAQTILSSGYYLDFMLPAAYHYGIEPLSGEIANLPPEAQSKILGGEACMWAEYVSQETVEGRIWPRMAAIAERFWSPRDVTDTASMYRRLEIVSRQLEFTGLRHRGNSESMLDRLSGYERSDALRDLAGAIEPIKEWGRAVIEEKLRDQQSPLNRLVDSVPPESAVARDFAGMVDAFLAGDRSYEPAIREQLTLWRDQNAKLAPLFKSSFLLAEDAPVSADLARDAAAGLVALDALNGQATSDSGQALAPDSLSSEKAAYRAPLLIAVLPSIEKLVNAARK